MPRLRLRNDLHRGVKWGGASRWRSDEDETHPWTFPRMEGVEPTDDDADRQCAAALGDHSQFQRRDGPRAGSGSSVRCLRRWQRDDDGAAAGLSATPRSGRRTTDIAIDRPTEDAPTSEGKGCVLRCGMAGAASPGPRAKPD